MAKRVKLVREIDPSKWGKDQDAYGPVVGTVISEPLFNNTNPDAPSCSFVVYTNRPWRGKPRENFHRIELWHDKARAAFEVIKPGETRVAFWGNATLDKKTVSTIQWLFERDSTPIVYDGDDVPF